MCEPLQIGLQKAFLKKLFKFAIWKVRGRKTMLASFCVMGECRCQSPWSWSVLGVGLNCSTQASVGTSMGAAGDVGRVECGKCGALMTLHTWKKKVGMRTRHGSVSYRSRTMKTWRCGYCDWVLPTTWPQVPTNSALGVQQQQVGGDSTTTTQHVWASGRLSECW